MTNFVPFADRPKKLRVYTLRVDSLEASTKYEGKWVVNGVLGTQDVPVTLWMTTKQAGSIQRNLDADMLYCVVDMINSDKTRFVWASNNREWLVGSFLGGKEEQDTQSVGFDLEGPSSVTTAPKKKPVYQAPPNRFELGDEELPF